MAKRAGFHPTEVQGALYSPIYWGEQIIAEFLNIHPMIIWPDRYDKRAILFTHTLLLKILNHFALPVKKKEFRSTDMIKQYYSISELLTLDIPSFPKTAFGMQKKRNANAGKVKCVIN